MRQNAALCGKGLKELKESMNWCSGWRDVTEILLKMALNTNQSINLYEVITRSKSTVPDTTDSPGPCWEGYRGRSERNK